MRAFNVEILAFLQAGKREAFRLERAVFPLAHFTPSHCEGQIPCLTGTAGPSVLAGRFGKAGQISRERASCLTSHGRFPECVARWETLMWVKQMRDTLVASKVVIS